MPTRTSSTRTCLVIACLVAVVGAGLRMAVPVTPVDPAFAEVVQLYRAVEETSRRPPGGP